MAYVNSKSSKMDLLKNAFLILSNELENANTIFRNQPKFFKKIFGEYIAGEKGKDVLLSNLTKLSGTGKFERKILFSSFTDILKKSGYNDDQIKIVENVAGFNNNVIDMLSKIVSAYDLEKKVQNHNELNSYEEDVIENFERDINFGVTNVDFKMGNDINFDSLEDSNFVVSELSRNDSKKENLSSNSSIVDIVSKSMKNEEKYKSQLRDVFRDYDLNDMEIEQIKDIILLNSRVNDKNLGNFLIENSREKLVSLIYNYCTLKSKVELNPNERVLLELLEKYNPLDLLKKFEKNHGIAFSYDNIIKTVNQMLESDMDEIFKYYRSDSNVFDSALAYKVSGMTSLMSLDKIKNLYTKYSSDYKNFNDVHTIGNLQMIFSSAIQNNIAYQSLVNLNNNEEKGVERFIICVDYFKELPSFVSSKEELNNLILSKINDPKTVELMKKIVEQLSFVDDVAITNDTGRSR